MAIAEVPSIVVYNEHVIELMHVLPMDDPRFISDLKRSQLLPSYIEEKLEGLSGFNKSSYFLDEMIKWPLMIDDDSNLHKLLSVMNNNDRPHVVELARKMEARIKGESDTKPGMIAQLRNTFKNSFLHKNM